MTDITATPRFWDRSHHLGRMGLGDLVRAYFTHYAVIVYLALTGLCIAAFARWPAPPVPTLAIVALIALAYPLIWYVLHRWVLHSRWMFKVRPLAGVWKRIHYDHHMDPDRLEILFGALHTTLPTLLLVAALPGWLIGGVGGALAGMATGLLCTCFYEFAHCVQHLGWKPRHPWLAMIKRRHMEHHFHDEDGNFGITNFAWDRLLGTYYTRADRPQKSPTVFNLGYTAEMAARYPAVAERSRDLARSRPGRGGARPGEFQGPSTGWPDSEAGGELSHGRPDGSDDDRPYCQ
ncbi:sterol desaturase family protein [Sphingomonadaceae bacterium jetA1]|jgi:sterol desaturase/sphingolipid hydroxylase (fatty acid hydroxylase superfamily)|uniref:sterol desaturase family protein n=1 Tax=Facivitalis istanbulensis TaxID=3075838 RepID=UPI0034756B69